MGGLSRRATILEEVKRNGPTLVVDAGDRASKTRLIPEERRPQQERKAELQLDALRLGGVDALTVGERDLALGKDWVVQHTQDLPMVSANLVCDGQLLFPTHLVVERGGQQVGLTGVIEPDLVQTAGCRGTNPIKAVGKAIKNMGPVDLVVVLSHGESPLDTELAEALPAIDLLINGHARLQHQKARALPGSAVQLSAGSKGKLVGVARLDLLDGAKGFSAHGSRDGIIERRERYQKRLQTAQKSLEEVGEDPRAKKRAQSQVTYYDKQVAEAKAELAALDAAPSGPHHRLENNLVGLNPQVADQPETQGLVDAALAEMARLDRPAAQPPPLTDTPFVGAERCGACHTEALAQWKTTPHSQAYAVLADRKQDFDCFECHVTGAFHPEGPQFPSQVTAAFQNVQCEACHGPGKAHVADPTQPMNRAAHPQACTGCHDGSRDEGRFDHSAYLPKVIHNTE